MNENEEVRRNEKWYKNKSKNEKSKPRDTKETTCHEEKQQTAMKTKTVSIEMIFVKQHQRELNERMLEKENLVHTIEIKANREKSR